MKQRSLASVVNCPVLSVKASIADLDRVASLIGRIGQADGLML
jgi:hypothetical protein